MQGTDSYAPLTLNSYAPLTLNSLQDWEKCSSVKEVRKTLFPHLPWLHLGNYLVFPFASVFSSGTQSYHYLIYMPCFYVLAISMCSTTKAIQLELRHMNIDINAFNIMSIQI